MIVEGKIAVITGAASGIGRALARRFKAEGAKAIAIADLQAGPLAEVAAELGALGLATDVTKEAEIKHLVTRTEAELGPIDIFCSNAGIAQLGGEAAPDAEWRLNWELHVMAHVYAARAVIPGMVARGGGYLVNTASAAGLLTHAYSATYSVTKHGAVAFAEYLSIAHGDDGIRVSVLCPQAVRTAMTAGHERGIASVDGMIEPEELATCVIETMAREEFLILPHREVIEYMRRKTSNYDRWLGGMRRFKKKYEPH